MKIRRSNERGTFNIDWLQAKYTFSFANYYDPRHMGFRSLRVINNDIIAPEGGFPTHSHRDMEIITFIIRGELAHKDSMGNAATITPGMIQIMSAGSGVSHSEFNPSSENDTELFQIWVESKERGTEPSYSEFRFEDRLEENKLNLIVSNNKHDEVGYVNQDIRIYYFDLKDKNFNLDADKAYWLQMIEGEATIGGESISHRDGISLEHENAQVQVKSAKGLLFEF
ncbi:pirin-like bicupin family protein [Bacteriovorax sp. Seq25_V]|uniref:pirin family protein n=1 Tax=Bacteriovorax sp. Seq25_V TaxID=1201288 RepID=UPI00038A1224|nr:pirin-like bicupin family protein [Bacteriovorax sp. Seq25_V]EQC45551.1 putative protein YhhW [Bacteriovorax sp. Seq25_V]